MTVPTRAPLNASLKSRETPQPSLPERPTMTDAWLPIVLCPTDGVDRMLLLPDGREVVGAYHNSGLGRQGGWETKTPIEHEMPVYEEAMRGGFIADPHLYRSRPEPERKQIGTRKEIMWLMGRLPENVYPTHFRPNDTVHGNPVVTNHD